MLKKWFFALVLPVLIQATVFLSLNYHGGSLLGTLANIALSTLLFGFLFWGALVLIPFSIAQILCARTLCRANCHHSVRFLVGFLNPSLALSLLIICGWIASVASSSSF